MRQPTSRFKMPDGSWVTYSLKKRHRDPFYLVSFNGPAGRCEKSTKCASERSALRAVGDVILGEYKGMKLTRLDWTEARARLAKLLTDAGNAKTTLEHMDRSVRNFERLFEDRPGPMDVRPVDGLAFAEALCLEGKSLRTVRNNVEQVSSAFKTWWIPAGLATVNPCAGVKEIMDVILSRENSKIGL